MYSPKLTKISRLPECEIDPGPPISPTSTKMEGQPPIAVKRLPSFTRIESGQTPTLFEIVDPEYEIGQYG